MSRSVNIFFLLLILFSIGVFAVPPQTSTNNDVELEIIYPKFEAYKEGYETKLYYHVYNATGLLMTNETTTCVIHIYNFTGAHILEQDLLWDDNNVDFYAELTPNIYNEVGDYSYLVHYNTTLQGGYISSTFQVTPTGKITDNNVILTAMLLFGGFILCLFFFYKNISKEEHWMLKVILQFMIFILGLVMLLYSYFLFIVGGSPLFIGLGDMNMTIFWIILLVTIFYFIYYFIFERPSKEFE